MATTNDVPEGKAAVPTEASAGAPLPSSSSSPAKALPLSGEPEGQQPIKAPVPTDQLEPPGLLSDCRLMLRYARANAFVLSPELIRQIAWLDTVLKLNNISPISALTSTLVGEVSTATAAIGYVSGTSSTVAPAAPGAGVPAAPAAGNPNPVPLSAEEVVLRVHSDLSLLISPTTALSLQSSEPAPGRVRIFGGMPRLIKTAIVIAVVSALAFVISAVNIKDTERPIKGVAPEDAAASTKVPTVDKKAPLQPAKEPASAVVPAASPPPAPPAASSGGAAAPKTAASAPSGTASGEKK